MEHSCLIQMQDCQRPDSYMSVQMGWLSCHVCAQVEAEKLAWKMSKEHGFDLVVMNPSLVLGTVISQRGDVFSMTQMKVIEAALMPIFNHGTLEFHTDAHGLVHRTVNTWRSCRNELSDTVIPRAGLVSRKQA